MIYLSQPNAGLLLLTSQLFSGRVKCLKPMLGDVRQARTKAAMLLLMIDTTSSLTCTKPIVEPTPSVKTIGVY